MLVDFQAICVAQSTVNELGGIESIKKPPLDNTCPYKYTRVVDTCDSRIPKCQKLCPNQDTTCFREDTSSKITGFLSLCYTYLVLNI